MKERTVSTQLTLLLFLSRIFSILEYTPALGDSMTGMTLLDPDCAQLSGAARASDSDAAFAVPLSGAKRSGLRLPRLACAWKDHSRSVPAALPRPSFRRICDLLHVYDQHRLFKKLPHTDLFCFWPQYARSAPALACKVLPAPEASFSYCLYSALFFSVW